MSPLCQGSSSWQAGGWAEPCTGLTRYGVAWEASKAVPPSLRLWNLRLAISPPRERSGSDSSWDSKKESLQVRAAAEYARLSGHGNHRDAYKEGERKRERERHGKAATGNNATKEQLLKLRAVWDQDETLMSEAPAHGRLS